MSYFYALLIVGAVLIGVPAPAHGQEMMSEEETIAFEQGVPPPCQGVGAFTKDCSPMTLSGDDGESCQEYVEVFSAVNWITHEDTCDNVGSTRN